MNRLALWLSAGLAVGTLAVAGAVGEPPIGDPAQGQPVAQPEIDPTQAVIITSGTRVGEPKKDEKFKPFKDVAASYEKIISTTDGSAGLFTLYIDEEKDKILAELPRGFERQKHLIATTQVSGDVFAGLQGGDSYVQWKRIGDRIALVEPNVSVRSTGDRESRMSAERIWTDRVVLDVPIVTMGPTGQPVIDLTDLLIDNASKFFGGAVRGANTRLATIAKAKSFPENIEIAIEMPGGDGRMRQFHWSIRNMPENTGYKPRESDPRVGYFTVSYRDLGKFDRDQVWTRYITRWNLEKADPKLKVSPPKQPIVFYIDHETPVRYRRWVRQGIEMWNEAFREVGIDGAIEVYYQDAATGANMDKDPEDARYNFIRWLANDISTAIGPSRPHPLTGEILDADIVLTDGWIRAFWYEANEFLPQIAMEGMSPETLQWLERHPEWDPRVRLASPEKRDEVMRQLGRRGVAALSAHPEFWTDAMAHADPTTLALAERMGAGASGLCMAAQGKAMEMAFAGMAMDVMGLLDDPEDGEPKGGDKPKKDEGDSLDGIPEWFVGPMLADLTAHEVGHTLGLRHNFKASAAYDLTQINSEEWKGKKALAASVMDYLPTNIRLTEEDGEIQGDYAMIKVGPYDMWAIEYGYGSGKPEEVAKRSAEPEFAYLTDEDTSGSDPLARRYDFAKDPLDYAENRMRIAEVFRDRILEKFVKDGQSWSRARRGYQITLNAQMGAVSIMSNWLGGTFVSRAQKGDPGASDPLTPVSAEQQRKALAFVIDNSFFDESFGLTPDLISKMTVDKFADEGGIRTLYSDATYPIHDTIAGIQSSVMTQLINPTTLRRVYDNELAVNSDQDYITLPEMMDAVSDATWKEINDKPSRQYSARQPMISSLRRNLQGEHVERLIDLTMPGALSGAAARPITDLAMMKLREIKDRIDPLIKDGQASQLDPYTLSHLQQVSVRIGKALDAGYIYNGGSGGGSIIYNIYGKEGEEPAGN
jgi:hypothetical protein